MLEAKQELEERISKGQAQPALSSRTLPLGNIQEIPAVFQPRHIQTFATEAHVRDLARAPKGGRPLEPVTVFWVGDAWAVIDGHHRLKAYRFAKWKKAIPVKVFDGSLDEAMAEAAHANSGAKLPMTASDRKASAWRLATTTKLSKERIVRASGMSDGFMAKMFRTRKQLREHLKLPDSVIAALSWFDAERKAAGTEEEREEINWDERVEEQAQDFANRLLKALGKRGQSNHEALARALEIYDRRLPDVLREHWDDTLGPVESLEEPDPDADF